MGDESEMGVITHQPRFLVDFWCLNYKTQPQILVSVWNPLHFFVNTCMYLGAITVHKVTKAYCTKTIHRWFIQLTKVRRRESVSVIIIIIIIIIIMIFDKLFQ